MFVGTVIFIISWIAFLFFSKKKKFPLYVLTGYTGIILALTSDLIMFVYPLWEYPGTSLETFLIQLLNGFGIYFVVIYFFLQTLPKIQTVLSVVRHVFYWSVFAIILELLLMSVDFIVHGLWWNIGFSYLADWILFTVFFLHHKWISNHSLINTY
ncbi:CBO0543 family protein [Bacillus piscicola]|uniref:CBO0543 family protein n=1 Tax=Bacillus piscicola TaxID=1632684 RepID=UPI003B8394BA